MLAARSIAAVAPNRCPVRHVRATTGTSGVSTSKVVPTSPISYRRLVRAKAVATDAATDDDLKENAYDSANTISDEVSALESPAPSSTAGENTFVQSIARQGRGENDGVTLDDLLAAKTGGPPRFFSPIRGGVDTGHGHMGQGQNTDEILSKPLLLYIPGLDGTGFAASAQFDGLHKDFNLSCLNIPVNDRSGFSDIVQLVVEYLEGVRVEQSEIASGSQSNSIYLLGESMGGLLSLGVAQQRPDLVDKLLLVNPASSFDRSAWPSIGPLLPLLPEAIYQGLPYALAPVLFDPPKLLEGAIKAAAVGVNASGANSSTEDPLATPAGLAAAAEELANLFPALGQLSNIIPRDTLAHRLGILVEGCEVVNAPGALESFGVDGNISSKKKTPSAPKTLVVISTDDNLIPSSDEGSRLKKRMPPGSCVVETLQGASHAALQEAGVDLVEILRANGFGPKRASDKPSISKDATFTPPSDKELQAAFDGLNGLRSVVSPVFFSTRDDGSIIQGLSAIPFSDGRPVLLVGNHQTIAPDLGFIIEQFIKERNVLPRGLAHPVVAGGGMGRSDTKRESAENKKDPSSSTPITLPDFFGIPPPPQVTELLTNARDAFDTATTSMRTAAENQSGNNAGQFGGGGGGGISQFTSFGAVPVSGKNLYKLLNQGECVLLFPGGVREAFKRKNERYLLFWPSKPEFIRMAARHNAVIVPFAAVGAEDGFDVVADADDVAGLPFGLGDGIIENSRKIPSARQVDTRVTEDGQLEEAFVQPLIVPKMPQRYYFKFGKPIFTEGLGLGKSALGTKKKSDASSSEKDDDTDAAVLATYKETQESVEDGIDWLLRRRGEDPFGDTPQRVVWEQAAGKQAPTFTP